MALRTLLATVDETLPVLPASTHREVNTHTKLNAVKFLKDPQSNQYQWQYLWSVNYLL